MIITHSSQQTLPQTGIRFRVETLIIILVGLLGLGLRIINLDLPLLSSAEADQALAALRYMRGAPIAPSHIHSALIHAVTLGSFTIFGPGNAAARLAPAISGFLLMLSPLLLRKQLGQTGALLMMLILAISPTAVMASRQLTGIGFAMLGVVVLIASADKLLETGRGWYAIICGISAAFVVCADFAAPLAMISLVGGIAFAMFTDEKGKPFLVAIREIAAIFNWKLALLAFGVSIIALSTAFFVIPGGIGISADLLGQFFAGASVRPDNTPFAGLVLATYEPYLLVAGFAGAWIAAQSHNVWARFLAGWGISSVLMLLVYPGVQPLHVLWGVVPLTAISVTVVQSSPSNDSSKPNWLIPVTTGVIVALVGMILASLIRQLRSPRLVPLTFASAPVANAPGFPVDLLLIMMWIVLGVIVWIVIASTWGTPNANRGIIAGFAVLGSIAMLGSSMYLAFSNPDSPFSLLSRYPSQPTMTELVKTMEQISTIATSEPHLATVTLEGNTDAAVIWAMRDFGNVSDVSIVGPEVQSVMVITPLGQETPDLGANYVGQDFVTVASWQPWKSDLAGILTWVLYHESSLQSVDQQRVILWVRSDIYNLTTQSGK